MKKVISIFLILIMLVLSASMLISCQEDSYIDPDTGERVNVKKIKFLHIWSENSTQFTKIVNDFMAENKDIRIETVVSNYEDVPSYLNSQVISSSVPDVFFYWTN